MSLQDDLNQAINTAVNILNFTDDKHIQEMAAHIADKLIPYVMQATCAHEKWEGIGESSKEGCISAKCYDCDAVFDHYSKIG